MARHALKEFYVLTGQEKRESIVVTDSATVKYVAESFPGADPTEPVWLCSRIESTGDAYPFTQTSKVYPVGQEPALAIPGVGGAGLKALFGDA
jgi:hypothetical protein